MNLTSYRRDLKVKKQELTGLLRQRQEIDRKIAHLQPLISHLEGLCRELGDRAAQEAASKVELNTGLTELARITLEEAFLPLSASELKKRMESKGFDFSKYSSPLTAIHTVLKRLVKSGKVKVIPQKAGKKAYQWVTLVDGLLTLLQTMDKVAQHAHPKVTSGKPGAGHEATSRSGTVTPPKR